MPELDRQAVAAQFLGQTLDPGSGLGGIVAGLRQLAQEPEKLAALPQRRQRLHRRGVHRHAPERRLERVGLGQRRTVDEPVDEKPDDSVFWGTRS